MKCGVMIMNQRDKWKKFIPVMAILAIAVILVLIVKISGEPLSVDTIVKYTPKNVALAVIMLILLFGLKSLTIVLPLSILYLASGILFSPVLCSLVQLVCLSPLQFRIVLENVVENRLQKKYFRNIRRQRSYQNIKNKIHFLLAL